MNSVRWSRRRAAVAAIAAGSAGLMSFYAVTTASASTPPSGKMAVSQGISLAGLNATPVFPVGPKTYEVVSFVLKERNGAALARKVDAGWKGKFLSVSQFAGAYGQSGARVKALENYLRKYGLRTKAYADHLVVTATGTAAEFNRALTVRQDEFTTKATAARNGQAARPAVQFHATTDAPLLPRTIAVYVESILGLDNYPLMASNAHRAPMLTGGKAGQAVQLGTRTPGDFARDYHLTPLTRAGSEGQGQTLGIITFASVKPADATYFWSKVLRIKTKKDRITLDKIDYGSGPVSYALGSGETTLDVEQSGAIAPQANIVVYEAPNSDFGTIDAYASAASQNKAATISCSWGSSETVLTYLDANGKESATLIQATDELLLELGAQGQSNFTASDDEGAYAASADLGSTNLSVQNASDSPWTTAAGGTTLPGNIPIIDQVNQNAKPVYAGIARERAWGWDWFWPFWKRFLCNTGTATAPNEVPCTSEDQFILTAGVVAGSGGGFSTVEARPGYQSNVKNIGSYSAVPYLTPTDPQTIAPGVTEPVSWSLWDNGTGKPVAPTTIQGVGSGRAVPDLAADADPFTGYIEYFSGFPASVGPTLEGGWGGTSFVAPQLNGAAAVINSYLGHRVGFWNPAMYHFAVTRNSPFTALNASGPSNDNLFFTGTKGHVFNPATGLGTPNLAKLAADFRSFR